MLELLEALKGESTIVLWSVSDDTASLETKFRQVTTRLIHQLLDSNYEQLADDGHGGGARKALEERVAGCDLPRLLQCFE